MADIDFTHTHAETKDGAKEAAERVAERLGDEYGLSHRWEGDTLRVERSGADGRLDVGEDEVRVRISTSWWLPVSEDTIRQEVERLLGEHLPAEK